MEHGKKKKMARKMLTKKERTEHKPLFQSSAWEKRAKLRHQKEIKRIKH